MSARLVRDRIGEVAWAPEMEPAKALLRPVTGDFEHLTLLKAKLLEEATELVFADQGGGDITEEIGDVLAVLEAMAKAYRLSMVTVMSVKAAKERDRGGFTEGTVLMS